jgi:hypothetical protein
MFDHVSYTNLLKKKRRKADQMHPFLRHHPVSCAMRLHMAMVIPANPSNGTLARRNSP